MCPMWRRECEKLFVVVLCVVSVSQIAARNPFEADATFAARTRIDEFVLADLEKHGLEPAKICSDAVFVRRVYLDTIGTLPSAQEAREFVLSADSGKRRALIDRLLERDEFADYWAMKWSDLLRVKAEFPINLWPNAAQAYHHWIREAIRENKPYDQFARELLTSNGSNFRVPPVNFYRALQDKEPKAIARAVALTFMGVRAENWPAERLDGMASFFSQLGYKSTGEWKEEIVFYDPTRATNGLWKTAVFPDGAMARLQPGVDPREAFADWLINPRNEWFTRNIANRVWAWLIGRGIIHEPDDIRPDNPPANAELLALLESELIDAHYDLKRLYRLILNSQTYQLSCVPADAAPEGAAHFASYPLRRLEAEVLIDALNEITGSSEKYSSAIPEPFTFIPDDMRSISLPDGSITSPFLDTFGRSPRDTGLESERSIRPTGAQRLHLLNSSHVLRKIEQSRMVQFQSQGNKPPRAIATALYLGILSRFPTESELKSAEMYSGSIAKREFVVDLAWALINSPEFLFRH